MIKFNCIESVISGGAAERLLKFVFKCFAKDRKFLTVPVFRGLIMKSMHRYRRKGMNYEKNTYFEL